MAKATDAKKRISERRKTREKRKGRYKVYKIVFALIGIYFISLLIRGMGSDITTYIARMGAIEEAKTTEGYIFRDQTVLNAPSDGIFYSEVPECTRVKEGETVAYIYQGEVTPADIEEIRDLRTQIKSIEDGADKKVYVSTEIWAEQKISKIVRQLSEQRSQPDLQKVASLKDELDLMIDKKRAIMGERPSDEEVLNNLKNRLAELEGGIEGGKTALVAPFGGVYSSKLDGFEDKLGLDAVDKLTPSILNEYDKSEASGTDVVQKDMPVCKLVNNYNWCYATNIDEKDAEQFKVGQNVEMSFYDMTDISIVGLIKYISAPEAGKVTVVVSTNRYVESIYSTSRASAEILTESYKGIKLPTECLRVLNDKIGVYVVRLDTARFVPVNVIYKNDDFCIVSAVESGEYRLKIYDEVIVKGKNIEEGKVVR